MRLKHLVEQPDKVDEALKDYIGLVGNALAGVVSARHRGKAEVSRVLIDTKKAFMQHMGRNGQDWSTVTWGTLYKYLSMPKQLGLQKDEISRILRDSSVQSKILNLISKQSSKQLGTSPGKQQISTDQMKKSWGKNNEIISGVEDKDSAKRAEIAVTYILELGAIKWLERKDSPSEMPDDTQSANSAPVEPGEQPQSATASNAANIDQNTIDRIKQELTKLKGGNP